MGISKAEVRLRRLLASMPNQDNPRKLVHYVTTARELLTLLMGESAEQDLPSVSSEQAKEYMQKIEGFAEKISERALPDIWDALLDNGLAAAEFSNICTSQETESEIADMTYPVSVPVIRKRHNSQETEPEIADITYPVSVPLIRKRHKQNFQKEQEIQEVALDDPTRERIDRHRRLQEDLTDEMVNMARQMKETTMQMNQSLMESEKILSSTEHAVEHSLASTNRANTRAGEIYSRSFMTGCFSWILMFVMFCIFLFMVVIIRIT